MKKILLLCALSFFGICMSQTPQTLTLGSSTSSSSGRGPFQRSDDGSSSVYSRASLIYTATELSNLTSTAVISKINFDLGSTNVITASGNATMLIYMKNSSATGVPASEDWTNIISGATLVGSYTFNTTNNFPGTEGFFSFDLDTDFNYGGGTLEVAVEWDCSNLVPADAGQPNLLFSGNGSLNWHWSSTAHQSVLNRAGSSSAPSTLNSQKAERVNTQFVYTDPNAFNMLALGTSTSSSSGRGPFQRSDDGSSSVYSRASLIYTATELSSLTSNAIISKIDYDLGSTNIITASGNATMSIYMKNSSATDVPASEDWTNIISGATLVGTYTFNTTNNFPGTEGFFSFDLDTDFVYTGGTLEVAVDWDCSNLVPADAGQPNLLFSGNGSLNWHWSSTTHQSVLNRAGSSSAPSTLNSQKAERANTQFTYKILTSSTWDGSTDNDWDTAANWSSNAIPNELVSVTIPSGLTNYPTASSAVVTNGITIASGASFIANSTVTGNIMYNLAIPDANWHLVAAPVSGETYGGSTSWIADSSIASGSTNSDNRGIATYQNGTPNGTTGPWIYYSNASGSETTFASGTGYSMKTTAAATYGFTGTYPTLPNTPTITQDVNNWNLVGNPAPSYIDVAAYITANSSNLSTGAFQALYVYSSGSGYTGLTSGYIHPGQAFFVNSNVASGTVSTTAAMLSHQTGVTFHKNSTTSIELTISEGNTSRKTSLEYVDDGTLGLDPGKDIGRFNGVDVSLSIYTNLLENNENIAFEKQALPNSDFETMVIPIGVKADSGKEIIISATSLNLPDGINIYLEDREKSVTTNLNDSNYKITLNEALNGTGRFYLYASSKTVLNTEDTILNSVSIFKTNNSNLSISGLSQGEASVKIFSILGKQVFNSSFVASGVKNITLPNLTSGVYIVALETESGSINKKIILE